MRYTSILVLLLLGACVSDSDRAGKESKQAAVDQAVAEHNATADKKDRVICTYEQSTGSNFKRRVCRTVAEREQIQRDAQEVMGNSRTTLSGGAEN